MMNKVLISTLGVASMFLFQQAHAGTYNCGTQASGKYEFSSANELKSMINGYRNSDGYIFKEFYGNDKSFEITKVTDVRGTMMVFSQNAEAKCRLTLDVDIINRQPNRPIKKRRVRHGKAKFSGFFGETGIFKDCWKPYTFEITQLDSTTSARQSKMSSEINNILREKSDKLCIGHLELNTL